MNEVDISPRLGTSWSRNGTTTSPSGSTFGCGDRTGTASPGIGPRDPLARARRARGGDRPSAGRVERGRALRSSSRSPTARRGSTTTSTRAATSRTSTGISTPPSRPASPSSAAPLVPRCRPSPAEARASWPPGRRAVPERAIWRINWVVLTSFFVLLLLIRWAVEPRSPRAGVLVAVMLGLGTMLLPFARAYFAHVLSATLAFAAFALLLRERERRPVAPRCRRACWLDLPSRRTAACRRRAVLGALRSRRPPPGAPRRAVRRRPGRRLAAALRLQRVGVRLAAPERLLQRGPGGRVDRSRRHRRQRHRLLRADPAPARGALRLALFGARTFVLMPVTLVAVAGLPLLALAGKEEASWSAGGRRRAPLQRCLLPAVRRWVPRSRPRPRAAVSGASRSRPRCSGGRSSRSRRSGLGLLDDLRDDRGALLAEDISPASWIGDIVDEHELANSVFLNGAFVGRAARCPRSERSSSATVAAHLRRTSG